MNRQDIAVVAVNASIAMDEHREMQQTEQTLNKDTRLGTWARVPRAERSLWRAGAHARPYKARDPGRHSQRARMPPGVARTRVVVPPPTANHETPRRGVGRERAGSTLST